MLMMGPPNSGTPRGLVPVGHFGDSALGLQKTWRGRLGGGGGVRCQRPGHFPSSQLSWDQDTNPYVRCVARRAGGGKSSRIIPGDP